jgi:uncharacterized protein YueI
MYGGVRMSKDVEDYLQEGMLGVLENKPDERRKYLGTLRERVVVALTQGQVRESGIYKESLQSLMKEHLNTKLILNGNMDYSSLSEYIKLADQYNIPYTMTVNSDYNSEFGLLLAYDYAIDKEEIMLNENNDSDDTEEKGIKKFLDKLY